MVVGTIGEGVPVEILGAARVAVVPVVGEPGAPTALADDFIEPMVGGRVRSQLQRLLDGTYRGLDLVLVSREHDALLRLFYVLREIGRVEPSLPVPPVQIVDLQSVMTPAASAWNEARVRDLCTRLEVDEAALGATIRRCNAERSATRTAADAGRHRRVLVSGSAHGDTLLARALAAAGCVVVDPPPILVEEDGDPIAAVARRYAHPRIAGARASSLERARTTVEDARTVEADAVVLFYLDGEDGVRWELPEVRAALEAADIPTVVLDRQPYDLADLVVHV